MSHPGGGNSGIEAWLERARVWSDASLAAALDRLTATDGGAAPEGEDSDDAAEFADSAPPRLVEALRYALLGGGKRLRPALVRLVAEELGGDARAAEAPAVAIEMVHTYSLVHDDLPAMDDDDLRRGRPTCHVAFGEATAVLVGDALQALAFETLATRGVPAAELVLVLARASGATGLVGGQVLDLFADQRPPGAEGVRATHAGKTAALFGAAAEMGALVAGARDERRAAARRFGRALGLAFQAVDDVLDVTGDAATLGKTPGKDAALERHSLVAHLGLEGARREAARRGTQARAALADLGLGADSPAAALVEHLLERRA